MSKLYILCGLAFAGKTTLANELVKRFGFTRITIDEINNERGVGKSPNEMITQNEWDKTYKESFKRISKALEKGKTVISDAVNFTNEQRDYLRNIANRCGATAKVIYVNPPQGIAQARWLENKKTGLRPDVRADDFSQVADNFQPPTEDENAIVYDGISDLDSWIKQSL